MVSKEKFAPLIGRVVEKMTSSEFTTYDFIMAFALEQEQAYVTALHEAIDQKGGPFKMVEAMLEGLLAESESIRLLRDGARGIDMFGNPGMTNLWQRKR